MIAFGGSISGEQTRTSPESSPKIVGIAHVAIRVADVAISRDFFEKLGYVQPFELTGKDGKVNESFIKISDHQWIELYPPDGAHPPAFLHVCFEAVNIDSLYTIYAANGMVAPPVRKAGAGNKLIAWKGPEGQTEEITEYMPGSRHSNDFGQHLGADRISDHLIGAIVPMQNPKAAVDYFTQKMNFTDAGAREAALLTLPPGVHDAYFGFLPSFFQEKLVLVFQVPSIQKAAHRLQSIGISAQTEHGRLMTHDPDGSLLVYVDADSR
jgi:catechol 2,3-dioxygenase-like lactoylglutathione lyase family enzyme